MVLPAGVVYHIVHQRALVKPDLWFGRTCEGLGVNDDEARLDCGIIEDSDLYKENTREQWGG